ncbi:MAG: hypothetical protein PHS07_00135 [Patescibacteria group bacterium]|jgi:outer membrane lipoprotein-sorting protein|nr:hypothetical protein [Patescibacteria group bacterium]
MSKKTILILILALSLTLAGCGKKNNSEINNSQNDLNSFLNNLEKVQQMSYQEVANINGQEMITQGYVKNNKIRKETSMLGQEVVMIINQDAQVVYLYMPNQNTAMQLQLTALQSEDLSTPEERKNMIDDTCRETGKEIIDDKKCLVIECQQPEQKITMWLWEKYGLTLKSIMESNDMSSTYEVKNISFDDIDDSLFELPVGVQMMDMPDMLNFDPEL